ncbi:MAG: MoaD/ThiS family protein [Candidatus Hermodarchaeota archaeon]
MNVEVLYFAEFKDITGKEKEKFDLSSNNLQGVLNLLFEKYNLRKLVWDEKEQKLHNLISVIVNNQAIHEKNPSLVRLKDGDTIAFLLPVSGG